ncbi:MAG: GNAT family N-acetyltransferase [Fluviibacter sp.]|jgi:predicted GNAT family N-acyltransferase
MNLLAPTTLTSHHKLDAFSSGEPILDDWLKRRAMINQTSGASRTFVAANDQLEVMAYYALAAGAVAHQDATRKVRQNMPDPVPVLILGRLAVDQQIHGQKLGGALLQDAFKRSLLVAQNTGVRALLVHALNDRASAFYQHYGFQASPINPMTLMLPLNRIP